MGTTWGLTLACCALVSCTRIAREEGRASPEPAPSTEPGRTDHVRPPLRELPAEPFRPSNARTVDGAPVAFADFIPAERCAGCHADTYRSWSESLHRNSGREPFYKHSVDLLIAERGIELSRHCEGCHLPVSMLSGALTAGSTVPRTLDDQGVTCSVCHSIVDARVDGTGSYTIAKPALLVTADGTSIRDATDAEILADIVGHKRAVGRAPLRTPELCATCHKSAVPPDLSGYPDHQRGFNVYDEWQLSAFSQEASASMVDGAGRKDCNACHMPRVRSSDDRGATQGRISSHRWLGANEAVATFHGAAEQAAATRAFLESGVVSVDVFAIESERTGKRIEAATASALGELQLRSGDRAHVDVVVATRRVGHSFPPELRDLYEAWVQVRVESGGRLVYESGGLANDGSLEPDAHVYRQVLLDANRKVVGRHEVWNAIGKHCDNRVAPGQPDLARFTFVVPDQPSADGLTVTATVKYRRFTKAYSDFVLSKERKSQVIPAIEMARDELRPGGRSRGAEADARRWSDYGQSLLGRSDRHAVTAFAMARRLDPSSVDYRINQAIAELRTTRTDPVEAHARAALELLAGAGDGARARYWRAVALDASGDRGGARNLLIALAAELPRDREVWRRLGMSMAAAQEWAEARATFTKVTAIDPMDSDAWQRMITAAIAEGRRDLAVQYTEAYDLVARFANPALEGPCDSHGARH